MTLLGGGFARETDLAKALDIAPTLVCADGGGNRALDWGHHPAGIVGDLDSVDVARMRGAGVPLWFVDDQNTTDLEKCLAVLSAPLVIGVGFLGGRFDHSLAAMNVLCRHPERAVVLVGVEDVVFRLPASLSLELVKGTRVSLFPMNDVQASSSGLLWPIEGLKFSPTTQIGCSNAALGGSVGLEVTRGDMICVLPRDQLGAVVAAVSVF